jgi:hypothetical protein
MAKPFTPTSAGVPNVRKEFEKREAAKKAEAIAVEAKRDANKANIREDRLNFTPTPIAKTQTVPTKSSAVQSTSSNKLFIGPIPMGTVRTATGYEPATVKKESEPGKVKQETVVANTGQTTFMTGAIVAIPQTPNLSVTVSPPPPPVKTATLDIILFDEEVVTTDGMFDQIFENIGGQELINITRSDIVNGQKISYQPIKNLSAIQQIYNSNNIISLQQTSDKFFAGFSIKLEDKIPETGNGTNGENVYLNATGDLIIEFININPDEQIETQISVSGTIYEADLGDYAS